MRKSKINKVPIYVDIRAGETVWTPDGVLTAPTHARRYVFLDCQGRTGNHLHYEFVAVIDYLNQICDGNCNRCIHERRSGSDHCLAGCEVQL